MPVTSGSKGIQVYAVVPRSHSSDELSALAQQLAQELTGEFPDLVVWKMATALRPGKVFVDWSQNTAAKTTISPYSLRGKGAPFAAAPRTWEELERGATTPEGLTQVLADEVLTRVERQGDLAAALLG